MERGQPKVNQGQPIPANQLMVLKKFNKLFVQMVICPWALNSASSFSQLEKPKDGQSLPFLSEPIRYSFMPQSSQVSDTWLKFEIVQNRFDQMNE